MEWGKHLPHETRMWVHIHPQPDINLLFINLAYDFCLFYYSYIFTIYTHILNVVS